MDSLLGLLSRERDQKAFLHINEDDNKDDSSSSHRKYPLDSSLGAPFPASVFLAEDAQWELLKSFSIENKLSQLFLNKLFQRFLSTKEAPLRQFRVLISDIKDRFLLSAAPFNELADLLIPHILLKSTYSGLMEAHSTTEISFTRLVITLFTFCHAPMPDLIFDFLAACRGNHNLSMNAYIYGFNFQQIILLFTENLVHIPLFLFPLKFYSLLLTV